MAAKKSTEVLIGGKVFTISGYEDEDYLVITVPNKDGAEFAKIIPKSTILSVELIYAQMLEKPTPFKEDGMYG